ncbi:CHAT domain-containing protein [Actinophytocola sp.]|uniref:CHAT domain-containing protein n=1 Tax=Actinophytocola sp. TaxID=1872138 RepID=UPI003899E7F9
MDTAELAFLSACSTARGGLLLSDETIHLGRAFQLAGFRHVIATLWPVEDSAAATVARATYRSMRAGSDVDQAALALHTATRALRRRAPTQPTRWAAHVHTGA